MHNLAAYLPLILAAFVFIGYCLTVLIRERARYLPKWLWAVLICLSVPFGGVIFLMYGRTHEHAHQLR